MNPFCFTGAVVAFARAGGEGLDPNLCQRHGGQERPCLYFGVGCHDQEQEGFDACSSKRTSD